MEAVQQKPNSSDERLGTGKIGRLLFSLALPAITAQVINALYNVVDRMYLGHYNPDALTGLGITFPIIMIIAAFAALVGMGGAPLASIHLGRGDKERAEKLLGNCFAAQIIVSIVLTVLVLIFLKPMLWAFGASTATFDFAFQYMVIYASGTIFVQLALGLNPFITAQGYSRVGMLTIIIGAAANIILDPIFIFAFNMGVSGAAAATVIAQALSAAFVVYFLFSKRSKLRIRPRNMKIVPKLLFSAMALGLSPFIMQATESALILCFNTSLQKFGGDPAVGMMAILSSVMQFAMLPLQGLTQGAQPIISYNYGAGKPDRVKKAFKLLLICSLVYSLTMWLTVMLFPGMYAAMFGKSPEITRLTKWGLRIFMFSSGIFGAQIACQQTFIALGNAKTSMFLALLRKVIVLIPLIYILPLFQTDKVFAVLLAEPVADAIAVLTTTTMFAFSFTKLLKRMRENAPQQPALATADGQSVNTVGGEPMPDRDQNFTVNSDGAELGAERSASMRTDALGATVFPQCDEAACDANTGLSDFATADLAAAQSLTAPDTALEQADRAK